MLKNLGSTFKTVIKTHKKTAILFLIGSILLLLASILRNQSPTLQHTSTSFIKLLGLISVTFSIFTFGVKAKRPLISNIGLLVFLIFTFELACFFLLGMPEKPLKSFIPEDLPADHIGSQIGTVPPADTSLQDQKIINGEVIYDVHYTFNENHIRVTPDHDSTKQKYALFFGCSIGFGLGLEDNQTLAYQVQQASDYNAYNYAYSGYGTNHMLARLQYQNLRKLTPAKETNGVGLYIYFSDHINRSIGTMQRHTDWLHTAPLYEMHDGKLVRNKSFKAGRPIQSKIYETLYQSSIVKYFNLDFPLSIKERHLDLASEMVLESKKEYMRQFGNDQFYVVLYPTYQEEDPENYAKFLTFLKKKGIKYIDLRKNFDYKWSYAIHNLEPHPGAEVNKLLGKRLANELQRLHR
jgi:hypothetical protein